MATTRLGMCDKRKNISFYGQNQAETITVQINEVTSCFHNYSDGRLVARVIPEVVSSG